MDGTGAENGFRNAPVADPVGGVAWAGSGSKGALRQDGGTRITEITDGTSNTTLDSEIAGRDKLCQGRKCKALPVPNPTDTGLIWAYADNRITVTGADANGDANPNGASCLNVSNVSGDIYAFHTGGANVAFADGSVRLLRDNLTSVQLVKMVTKSGGEIVSFD